MYWPGSMHATSMMTLPFETTSSKKFRWASAPGVDEVGSPEAFGQLNRRPDGDEVGVVAEFLADLHQRQRDGNLRLVRVDQRVLKVDRPIHLAFMGAERFEPGFQFEAAVGVQDALIDVVEHIDRAGLGRPVDVAAKLRQIADVDPLLRGRPSRSRNCKLPYSGWRQMSCPRCLSGTCRMIQI